MNLLYVLSVLTVALHLVGGGFSLYLTWRSYGDFRWTGQPGRMRDRHGRERRATARHAFVAEAERFLAQIALLAIRLPTLFVATDRYSPILNDLWLLVLVSAIGNAVVALLLAHSSIDYWFLRERNLRRGA